VVELSNTALAVVGGVIAAVITAFYQLFATLSARQSRQIDRAIELQNRRREAYQRYLAAYNGYSSLYDLHPPPAENSKERIEAVKEYWLAYGSLFQIASDPVLLAASDFHKLAWVYDTDLTGKGFEQEFKTLYASMIIEMRKDAFERTLLRKELVEARIPFDLNPRS
jgi:hypothetical protein